MKKTYEEVDVSTSPYRVGYVRSRSLEGAKQHHNSRASFVMYMNDGTLWRKSWYRHGVRHRKDGPADIEYFPNDVLPGDPRTLEELQRDTKVRTFWYLNGEFRDI